MEWIYLSPHLDDIALSCGGLVWEQADAGDRTTIWSLCAGDPPAGELSPFAESLHMRWNTGGEPSAMRRSEDTLACARLKAGYRHFSIPDCIYRRSSEDGHPLYTSEEAIFGPLDPSEQPLVEEVADGMRRLLPVEADLVCPLAVGGHVDHRLVRAAAEKVGRALWYYADYPYVERFSGQIRELLPGGCEQVFWTISEEGMQAWIESVAAHQSQIGSFWPDIESMEAALRRYCRKKRRHPVVEAGWPRCMIHLCIQIR